MSDPLETDAAPWLDDEAPHAEPHSRRQIDGLLELLGPGPRRTLDLGCGAGRVLVPLATAGHDVTGLDRDAGTLDRCGMRLAEAGVEAVLAPGDFREPLPFETHAFDVVLCLGNTFMTVTDVDAAVRLLGEVVRVLAPGGFFVIDDCPADFWPELTGGNWQGGISEDGQAQMVWSESDAIFTLRQGDRVDKHVWEIGEGERTFRLWSDGALTLAARMAGLSAPERLRSEHLLVLRGAGN